MPEINFIGQPFDSQLGTMLRTVLSDVGVKSLWIATAWGKASGLTRIGDAVKKARSERGLYAEIVLGVDENGATVEGLRHAMDIFDAAYVFHDPGSRTFHPKIYGAEGPKVATVIVGSGNLTKGGLYTNYEASTVVRVADRQDDLAGQGYVTKVRAFYDRLIDASDSCKKLTEESLAELRADPRLSVLSEAERNRARGTARKAKPGGDLSGGLFGSSIKGLLGAPQPTLPAIEADDDDTDESAPAVLPVSVAQAAPSDMPVPAPSASPEAATEEPDEEPDDGEANVTGFWKRLSKFDVSKTSSPGQIIIPIRFQDFFPELHDETDEKASGGAEQLAATFPVTFADGATSAQADDARVILYGPAPHQPRKNKELRFTFHDKPIQSRLSEGDVLEFSKDAGGSITVLRRSGASYSGRFASL